MADFLAGWRAEISFCMRINNLVSYYLDSGTIVNRRHDCQDICGKHFSSYCLAMEYRKCGIEI